MPNGLVFTLDIGGSTAETPRQGFAIGPVEVLATADHDSALGGLDTTSSDISIA